jgi:hypothetical protein
MKELRSKRNRNAQPQIMSDDEFDNMVAEGVVRVSNFIVTDIKVRKIIPPLAEVPKEVKTKIHKNEG